MASIWRGRVEVIASSNIRRDLDSSPSQVMRTLTCPAQIEQYSQTNGIEDIIGYALRHRESNAARQATALTSRISRAASLRVILVKKS
jgi:hypothetical protein